MSKFSIRLQEKGRCVITHALNESTVTTDLAPEYGGTGKFFSSTDLVASAVGTCLLTTLDRVLEREGYDSKKLEIKIEKVLSDSPKQIKSVDVKIFHPEPFSGVLIKKLYRAADTCPVKRSLNSDVDVSIKFIEMDR
jgi:putative redox protein